MTFTILLVLYYIIGVFLTVWGMRYIDDVKFPHLLLALFVGAAGPIAGLTFLAICYFVSGTSKLHDAVIFKKIGK